MIIKKGRQSKNVEDRRNERLYPAEFTSKKRLKKTIEPRDQHEPNVNPADVEFEKHISHYEPAKPQKINRTQVTPGKWKELDTFSTTPQKPKKKGKVGIDY